MVGIWSKFVQLNFKKQIYQLYCSLLSLTQTSFPTKAMLLIFNDQDCHWVPEIARVHVPRIFLYCRLKFPHEIWSQKEAFFFMNTKEKQLFLVLQLCPVISHISLWLKVFPNVSTFLNNVMMLLNLLLCCRKAVGSWYYIIHFLVFIFIDGEMVRHFSLCLIL